MKHSFFLFILIIGYSCVQNPKVQEADSAVDSLKTIQTTSVNIKSSSTIEGLYEYVYDHNTATLIENHYIEIKKVGDEYGGYYWGTSDEFDEAREEYYPGFFVAKMDTFVVKDGVISFTLDVNADDMFDKAIPQNIKTSDEARSAGFRKWEPMINYKQRQYKGKFIGKTIEFPDQYGDIRIFKKKK